VCAVLILVLVLAAVVPFSTKDAAFVRRFESRVEVPLLPL
jgi:hypothetical protein